MLETIKSAFELIRTSGVTVTDVCLVLAALLILVLLVNFFRSRSSSGSVPDVSHSKPTGVATAEEIDGELLAVISAAAYAYLGDSGRDSYKIVSVRSTRAVRSAWAQAGINHNTSRF